MVVDEVDAHDDIDDRLNEYDDAFVTVNEEEGHDDICEVSNTYYEYILSSWTSHWIFICETPRCKVYNVFFCHYRISNKGIYRSGILIIG